MMATSAGRLFRELLVWFATVLGLAVCTAGGEPVQGRSSIDFGRDVAPILQQRCLRCHGPRLQQNGLRLDVPEGAFKGGRSGPAVVPGAPERSPLYRRITARDENERMPRNGPPLSAAEIATIRRWIEEGAIWPPGYTIEWNPAAEHWAYRPIAKPRVRLPRRSTRARSPIDAFVLERLAEANMELSQPAPQPVLLRRVFLDLIGIPPSPEFAAEYLADRRPDKFDRLVDRLLASPAFGEKWARSWLDAARYADSNGYQADQYREVWPYRDWVIRAINQDMPFDQFTIEQLAGDLLPSATIDQRVATGFSRLTTCNVEAGVDPEENRVEQVVDRVNTVATVWLGTTLECAQCHDHKYDPFSMRDYYSLFAFFNNTPLEVEGDGVTYNFVGPKMELPLPPEVARQRATLLKRLKQLRGKLDDSVATAIDKLRQAVTTRADPPWTILRPVEFSSASGVDAKLLDDGSVLVLGEPADTDTYRVRFELQAGLVGAIRLEALTHPGLPGMGPGLHSSERPNFVLNEIRVWLLVHDERIELPLAAASADYAAPNYGPAKAIDGNGRTGWAIHPQFAKDHWIELRLGRPYPAQEGAILECELVQTHGGGRLLGRFRVLAAPAAPVRVPKAIENALRKEPDQRSKQEQKQLREYAVQKDPELAELAREIEELEKEVTKLRPPTTLVMVELPKPRTTHILIRGDYRTPGDVVKPDVPAILPPMKAEYPRNRLGLAFWLVDARNPLVARVTVNRWWTELFGRGIVPTPGDFGTQGEPPSHPRLLDWLASELRRHGWSRKRLLRTIVTSAVYGQDSKITPEHLRRDPQNRLLSRAPRYRLPAETIRDQALEVSGLLTRVMGGPPVYPPQPEGIWRHVGRNAPMYKTSVGRDRFRRGIYVIWRRSAPYPSFVNFDAPDRTSCVVQRPLSNTPLQALTLMNDQQYAEFALGLALRAVQAVPEHRDEARIEYAFRCCLVRSPSATEKYVLLELLREERNRLRAQPIDAFQRLEPLLPFVWPGRDASDLTEDEAVELASLWAVGNVLLNLDETINRE